MWVFYSMVDGIIQIFYTSISFVVSVLAQNSVMYAETFSTKILNCLSLQSTPYQRNRPTVVLLLEVWSRAHLRSVDMF